VERGRLNLAERVVLLVLTGGVLTIVGFLIAGATAVRTLGASCWIAYAPLSDNHPPTCGRVPPRTGIALSTGYHSSLSFRPFVSITPWWVVTLLVVGLGGIWAGCAWLLLRPQRVPAAPVGGP
jgi:hypothetical protein